LFSGCAQKGDRPTGSAAGDGMDRTVLPIKTPARPTFWALYVKDGIAAYDYNFLGMQRFTVAAGQKLTPGKHTIMFDFAYDGGGPGKGGLGTIYIDGKKAGEGRIERTQAGILSADETADVGIELATPVVERIGAEARSKFNGSIPKLVVEVK